MNTTEITRKSYLVNGKEYEVGEELKLPKRLKQMLTKLADISAETDASLERIYTALLAQEPGATSATQERAYFVEYLGLDSERKHLTGVLNRALYEHVGGFVPVRLELGDSPVAIIREFEPNEPAVVTDNFVAKTFGLDTVAYPAIRVLNAIKTDDTAVVTPIFPAWKATGCMVFTLDKPVDPQIPAAEITDTALLETSIIKSITRVLQEVPEGETIPYIVLAFGETNTVATAVNPNVNFTAEFANNAYAVTLNAANITRDRMTVFNVFSETAPVAGGKPETIVSIMYHISNGENRQSFALRFTRSKEGLVFKECWDSAAILAKAQELSKK